MKFRAVFALGLATAALVLGSPAASASAAVAYPDKPCSTLSVSTTNPLPGQSITVNGFLFAPHAKIRLELHNPTTVLRTVTSDAEGSFTTTVKLPKGLTGSHLLVAVGGDVAGGTGCPADPFQELHIQGAAAASTGNAGGSTTPGSGTAFTGLDVLGLLAGAAVLVGAGVMLQRGGKRKRAYAGRH